MTERRSERRSLAVGNDAQTRPDQTRVLVTASWGVSINACIRRTGCLGTDSTALNAARIATAAPTHAAPMHALREIGGGC